LRNSRRQNVAAGNDAHHTAAVVHNRKVAVTAVGQGAGRLDDGALAGIVRGDELAQSPTVAMADVDGVGHRPPQVMLSKDVSLRLAKWCPSCLRSQVSPRCPLAE